MIYDERTCTYSDGVWHCPFSPEWVERTRQLAAHCMKGIETERDDPLAVEFLDEPQDARGLPLSWCRKEAERFKGWADCCTAIYDYDTVPEVVATNGHDDWPLKMRERALTAG